MMFGLSAKEIEERGCDVDRARSAAAARSVGGDRAPDRRRSARASLNFSIRCSRDPMPASC